MILIFTDFGPRGPYVAQMTAALLHEAPSARVLELMNDAPAFRPHLAGYLLAHLLGDFPKESIVLGVVDPGVGTPRRPIVVHAGDRWFVGPDNGLFAPALRLAGGGAAWRIDWRPRRLSASFHGRDLFAPVAGKLLRGLPPPGQPVDPDTLTAMAEPDDLDRVIYIDAYGNAMTGRRADTVAANATIVVNGIHVGPGATFADVPPGQALWYRNSIGLVELAVNQGRADTALGLAIETPIAVAVG
jgi:hypothetical protein